MLFEFFNIIKKTDVVVGSFIVEILEYHNSFGKFTVCFSIRGVSIPSHDLIVGRKRWQMSLCH